MHQVPPARQPGRTYWAGIDGNRQPVLAYSPRRVDPGAKPHDRAELRHAGVSLKNGKTLIGVRVMETETMLTLADNQGQKACAGEADIEEQQTSPVSTMPEGLEVRYTENEFVDLIAFLESQKESRAP